MIRRITLENYMSHARTVIEPADGLTVLVGPNNCGKSAVVSALLSVCGETDSNYMVRHGEKLATVTVETDDGHTIVWRRKAKSTSYVIDGVEVSRIGRGNVPDNLHELLRMPRIEARGERFQVHFGLQKEPIFLLGDEKRTAAFFSSSAEAERLLEMQKLHAAKERQLKSEQRTVKAEVNRLTEKLALLEPLDALAEPVAALEAEHAALLADAAAIDRLAKSIRRIESVEADVAWHAARRSAAADLVPPPPMVETLLVERLIAGIARWRDEAERQSAAVAASAGLRSAPAMADAAALESLVRRVDAAAGDVSAWASRHRAAAALAEPPTLADEAAMAGVCDWFEKLSRAVATEAARVSAAEPLRDVPVPVDLKPLAAAVANVERAVAMVAANRARAAATAALAEPPALLDQGPLVQVGTKLAKAKADAERHQSDAARLAAELADVERQMIEWVTQNPVCPTCGSAVDAKHLIAGGASHVHA